MTRLEASAWPLAGGSACVFALAVVLDRLPWLVAFVAVALAVAAWAWLSPVIAGAAIGGIAWMCVTGFDVHRFGDIRITGSDDVVRAAVLILAGVLVASAHAVAEARRRYRRADPVWVEFYATGPVHASGTSAAISRENGAARLERRLPVRTDKEPSDG
ncbi:MAG TPA: hypothetical protein VGD53_30870 [Actinoallomurus sp.]